MPVYPRVMHVTLGKYLYKNIVTTAFRIGQVVSGVAISYYTNDMYQQIKGYKKLDEYQNQENFEKIENKTVGLILQSISDYNNAFKENDSVCIIRKINEGGFEPIYRKISSLKELTSIIDDLKKRNNKIKVLWFNCHGNTECLQIGENVYVDLESLSKINGSLNKIDEDATVVLNSCLTAGDRYIRNEVIAKEIAKSIPGRTIFASDECITRLPKITLNPFQVEFRATVYDNGVFNINATRVFKFPKK